MYVVIFEVDLFSRNFVSQSSQKFQLQYMAIYFIVMKTSQKSHK